MRKDKVLTKNSGYKTKPKDKFDYSRLNMLKWMLIFAWWREYPDRLLMLARAPDSKNGVAFLQSIYLRAAARYQQTFVTGSRGSTKTHCAFGSQNTEGILYPGTMSMHVGPTKEQSAGVISKAIEEYAQTFPLLMADWKAAADGVDSAKITTQEGSSIESHATLPSLRGENLSRVVAEECAQEDQFAKTFNHKVYRVVVKKAAPQYTEKQSRYRHCYRELLDCARCLWYSGY